MCETSSSSNGFSKNPYAPRRMASSAACLLLPPVMTTRGLDHRETFFDAVEVGREVKVADANVHGLAPENLYGLGARLGFENAVPLDECPVELTTEQTVVVHHEHRRLLVRLFGHASGSGIPLRPSRLRG
jgi:hypothetical protein